MKFPSHIKILILLRIKFVVGQLFSFVFLHREKRWTNLALAGQPKQASCCPVSRPSVSRLPWAERSGGGVSGLGWARVSGARRMWGSITLPMAAAGGSKGNPKSQWGAKAHSIEGGLWPTEAVETLPSAEVIPSCPLCAQLSCRVLAFTGWGYLPSLSQTGPQQPC